MKLFTARDIPMLKLMFLTLTVLLTTPSMAVPTIFSGGSGTSNPQGGEGSQTVTPLNRSNIFKACETETNMTWDQIQATPSFVTTAVSSQLVTQYAQSLAETDTTDGIANLKADVLNMWDFVMVCQAYHTVTKDSSNYTSDLEEFTDDQEHSSALGAQGLECMGQPDQQSQAQCLQQSQGQGELKCTQKGPETHDYLDCKRIVQFIDGFAIGKQVMQVQQTYRAGAQQLDAQTDLARKARSEEGVQITDAMGVQRDSLQQQANLAYEMMAFDGAKAGVLMSMISGFPRPQQFINTCKDNFSGAVSGGINTFRDSFFNGLKQGLDPQFHSEEIAEIDAAKAEAQTNIETYCNRAISTNPQFGGQNFLFENQEVIDIMKGIAIKAGLEALANGAKGALLNKQADLVEDAMDDIESFEPPEFPVAEAPEATTSECLVDPEAEGCIAPNTVGFEGFRDSGFSATVGGSANLGNDTNRANFDDDESTTNGAGNTDRSLIPNEFGVVEQTGDFSNDFADGVAQAGSIKAGQAAAAGGGGAGAGGGGGGGVAGGGGSRAPAAKKKPSGPRDIKIKTKGDGLMAVGGRGRIGAKRKKPSNPFSKLLGKDKKGSNKTLNFRGPAQLGGKKGSLFQMISNRYNVVQSKDRLLKYKAEQRPQ